MSLPSPSLLLGLLNSKNETNANVAGFSPDKYPDPLSKTHARAKAHQEESCLTEAVTSAVEVRLTPGYKPSWPEYLSVLVSGLALSPRPDITVETTCTKEKKE